jgi:hypothetical protein
MMSNQAREPAMSQWWIRLILTGLALLLCVAPAGAVLGGSVLIFSEAGPQACPTGSAAPVDPPPVATLPQDCGIDPHGNAVVAWALSIAAHLYPCPDMYDPGQLPPYMDTCYNQAMPRAVIQYWEETCPGCSQWQNGNLQCVMLVLAAFGLAGAPAPIAGNAITFWWSYAHLPGWIEIPSFFLPGSTSELAPPSARGLPRPGDMVVWYISWDPLVGHIAVVVNVTLPSPARLGSLTFAEANGPAPLYTMSINPDLSVNAWPGYYVAGYVRNIGVAPA